MVAQSIGQVVPRHKNKENCFYFVHENATPSENGGVVSQPRGHGSPSFDATGKAAAPPSSRIENLHVSFIRCRTNLVLPAETRSLLWEETPQPRRRPRPCLQPHRRTQ